MRPTDYGDVWADFLDTWTEMTGAVPPADLLDLVESLAGPGGRVLELGVGTGFLALPLAGRGLDVHGVDASPAMVERLRAKSDAVTAHVADAAALPPDLGRFDVVLFASSSIFCLPDADAQARCVAGAAALLADGGRLVVETYVPDPAWFTDGRLHWIQAEGDGWRMHWDSVHQPDAQVIDVERRLERDGEPDRRFPHRERYVLPDELDGMAATAGLRLVDRIEGRLVRSVYGRRAGSVRPRLAQISFVAREKFSV